MTNPGLTPVEIYKLRTEYGIEALKKIGVVVEVQNEMTGLIDVYYNNYIYMSYCPSGPSLDSFWIESPTEVDETRYNMLYILDDNNVKRKNLSQLN